MTGFFTAREQMVERQLAARGISSGALLDAMREVPREAFVPDQLRKRAYEDAPLSIGFAQTISQPYIVALMIEAAQIQPGDRILEVGAGSGYAAAVLGRVAGEVFAIERHAELAESAAERMLTLGYANVVIRQGDGSNGWPEKAPFDAILVSACGPRVPPELVIQLAMGGRLVMPIGAHGSVQTLTKTTRTGEDSSNHETLCEVRFVPLIGEHGWQAD